MKFTIINGTNRIGNKSLEVSKASQDIIKNLGHESRLITLDNFDALFRGEYINLKNANEAQKIDLENMIWADVLIFVVPTYHHGISSSLKNFLDIVGEVSVYEAKKIGLIASNGGIDGLRQTGQILSGILAFNNNNTYLLPKDCIVSVKDKEIDKDRLANYISYCVGFKT